MSYILDISTAVPEFSVTREELNTFYSQALDACGMDPIIKKLALFSEKTKINRRYSCIPDFNGKQYELFTEGGPIPSVEKRMELYKKKIMPLAAISIDKLLRKNNITADDITHLITVSCTGLFAPGLEFMIAEQYGLQHTEKLAVNFLGCYAAIKALKMADHIACSNAGACILIVSAELCTLHFYPSSSDEDLVANLLFSDGAAAAIVCGNASRHIKNRVVLSMDAAGSAYIPNTLDLMTWNISSSAFRMHLSRHLVKAIRNNIRPVVNNFLEGTEGEIDHWAIHPGGIRIVQAVQESLHLTEQNVEDSIHVLREYGNMSSPTILFILSRLLNKIRREKQDGNKKLFTCAFGPGVSIEMLQLSSVDTAVMNKNKYLAGDYAFQF